MKKRVFAELSAYDPPEVAREAREWEDLGLDGVQKEETAHDPFFPLLIAAEHTSRLQIMSAIAIGFARTPMLLANISHDLNAYSKGRFTLGIGSQIKTHIERRFSMPWSHPAARMREMVTAIRAIHSAWYDRTKLKFEGEFYKHTLMTPMFTPTNTEHGKPPIATAAVGPLMTQTAGAVSDGIILHPFSTEAFIRNYSVPHVKAGLESEKRDGASFRTYFGPFIITGHNEDQFDRLKKAVRDQLAFYASTPAYRAVLEQHGWGDVQPELQTLTQQGRWDELGALFTDEMLEQFAVIGELKDIGPKILKRYGDIVTDFSIPSFGVLDRQTIAAIAHALRS